MPSDKYSLLSIEPTRSDYEYHKMEINDIFEELNINPHKGLDDDQVAMARSIYGLNQIIQHTANKQPRCFFVNICFCFCFMITFPVFAIIAMGKYKILVIAFGILFLIFFLHLLANKHDRE